MSSVTSRIKQIKQPYGGYIKPSKFIREEYNDGYELKAENIHPSIVGLTVDYLSRFINGSPKLEAFIISLKGYELSKGQIDTTVNAFDLLDKINGLDDESIISAAKLVTFDVWYRNRLNAMNASKTDDINPDMNTINNIKIMVNRVVTFMKKVGPITQDGFTLEGGYTKTVTAGDGDYLTNDTIWDIKVSKSKITTEHTLQLAMYYI